MLECNKPLQATHDRDGVSVSRVHLQSRWHGNRHLSMSITTLGGDRQAITGDHPPTGTCTSPRMQSSSTRFSASARRRCRSIGSMTLSPPGVFAVRLGTKSTVASTRYVHATGSGGTPRWILRCLPLLGRPRLCNTSRNRAACQYAKFACSGDGSASLCSSCGSPPHERSPESRLAVARVQDPLVGIVGEVQAAARHLRAREYRPLGVRLGRDPVRLVRWQQRVEAGAVARQQSRSVSTIEDERVCGVFFQVTP